MLLSQPDDVGAIPLSAAPGPKGGLFMGSALDLKHDILGFMRHAMLEYGDVVRVRVGPSSERSLLTFVFHPDGAQHVLSGSADTYYKGTRVYNELSNLLGNGLLTSEGEAWKRGKRLLAPLFNRKRVAAYVPMIASEAASLVHRWRDIAASGASVDLHEEMTAVTLRVIGRAVFGAEVDHMVPALREAVPYLSARALQRGLAPVNIPAGWPTPGNRLAARQKATIFGLVNDLIANRRRHPTEGDDLVNLLIRAQDPDGGVDLSDEEVRDQALVFLLAGHETTATALTFALHLLGHHPQAQARLHEEVSLAAGLPELTLEDVHELSYTTMVVKEAMRLYPSASATSRTNRRPDVIGGYAIPPKSTVVLSPWATHRHPHFWDDPDRFDPERFTPQAEATRPRYAYFPFGGGPRACIGQHLSMIESVILTSAVISAFQVTTSPDPVPLFAGIALRPGREMPARLTLR